VSLETPDDPLPLRREAFVRHYVANGGNATQAAISAGYSPDTAYSQGGRLLKDVEVAAAIEKQRAAIRVRYDISDDRIQQELAGIAFATVTMTHDDKGRPFASDVDYPVKVQALDKLARMGGLYSTKAETTTEDGMTVSITIRKRGGSDDED